MPLVISGSRRLPESVLSGNGYHHIYRHNETKLSRGNWYLASTILSRVYPVFRSARELVTVVSLIPNQRVASSRDMKYSRSTGNIAVRIRLT